ncbi:MAG: hypothetical protein ABI199_10935 [Bacteroidia bacterium]
MNLQQFKQFIKTPEQLTAKDAAEIEKVLEQFPYFQTAHLLYLKALHNDNNINYNTQLKKAAAYSGNRTVLYQLIKKTSKTAEEKALQKNNISTPDLVAPKNEESIVRNLEREEEQILEPEKNNFSDAVDQEILKEAVSASFELNLIQVEEIKLESENPVVENLIEKANENFTKTKHSFSDWLRKTDGNETSISESKTTDNATDLISKFIEDAPKIKPKTAFYSPVNMARQSVMDDDFFVTETLANIYEQQGNYAKAIHAFEKLKIKHPQKNNFFNDKIRALKKLLNQKK